jgi:hypothetical protein
MGESGFAGVEKKLCLTWAILLPNLFDAYTIRIDSLICLNCKRNVVRRQKTILQSRSMGRIVSIITFRWDRREVPLSIPSASFSALETVSSMPARMGYANTKLPAARALVKAKE